MNFTHLIHNILHIIHIVHASIIDFKSHPKNIRTHTQKLLHSPSLFTPSVSITFCTLDGRLHPPKTNHPRPPFLNKCQHNNANRKPDCSAPPPRRIRSAGRSACGAKSWALCARLPVCWRSRCPCRSLSATSITSTIARPTRRRCRVRTSITWPAAPTYQVL